MLRHPPSVTRASGAAQQLPAVGILELGIGVGEQRADVAQAERTEQGVGDRMQERVGVGVAEQSVAVLDVDPPRTRRRPGTRAWTS